MGDLMNLAVIGLGRIGRIHAENINALPSINLVAVSDLNEVVAESFATTFGCLALSVSEIMASKNIQGVVICSPTPTHTELIKLGSKCGKAIFCEKPIDLSVSHVKKCLKFLNNSNSFLMIGFNRRFDPNFFQLKEKISTGNLGKPEIIQIISRDPNPPTREYTKNSGGIFKDMMIHDFDMALYILNEAPDSVMAFGSNIFTEFGDTKDYDTATAILTMPGGQQVIISNSRRTTYGYDQRVEVHCSQGTITAKNMRPSDIEIATKNGFSRPRLHEFFTSRYAEAYKIEMMAFVESFTNDTQPSPNGVDGLNSLLVAEAADKSARSGRPIKLLGIEV